MMSDYEERDDQDWLALLARIRKAARNGADRVQVDLESNVVVGSKKTTIDHA